MGFRINRGIFQFKDGEEFVNKFKIADDGNMVEVNREGEPIAAYMRIGDKATDADKLDGYHATNAGGGIPVLNSNGYWDAPSWINVKGNGLYSATANNAHFYPNNQLYGSWRIDGTRNGWNGLHFGGSNGVALMMNETESGIHRQNSGWKYRHQSGKFYVHTGTNGGGTGYPVWHEGTISTSEVSALKTSLGVTGLPYSCDIFVEGDPNLYYPVHFIWGDQDVWRRIIIKRGYSETAPPDWYTATHKGGLLLDWEGNFGGWGGATYSDRLRTFNESYSTICASMYRTTHSMGYTFFLRGGGAVYHIFSDQEIRGFHQVGTPDIAYDTSFKFYDNANASYIVYAPAPMDRQDVDRINSLRTLKRSELDSLYLGVSSKASDSDKLDGIDSSGFLRSTAKAADSNLLDGIDSSQFLRSDATDTASSRIDFTADESIRLKGARGQFTNEYIHLYNKVGIGHPNGWGQGQADTPDKGISTYGGANFAYGNNATSSFKGSLRVDVNWGANEYPEQFTVRGTYPSIALRSTTHNAKWLIHNDNNVSWYYGSAVDTDDWGLKFRIATNGNIWMQWAGGWLSDLLNAKETAGAANTVETALNTRIDNELRPAITTAQSTADSAVTAAAAAQATADVAETRANGAKTDAATALSTANGKIDKDSRNSRGVTRLYRRDSDSDYSVQHHWTGAQWHLRGYSGDNFHAEVRVGRADTAGTADSANAVTWGNVSGKPSTFTPSGHDHDRSFITDTRGAVRAPSYYDDRYAQWDFQHASDTGVGGDSWHALLTVSKWSSFNSGHRQEQLIFSGDHLWRRTAASDTAWGTNKKIWDSGNFDPSTKETAGAAATVERALNNRIDDELKPDISTAQTTANNAVAAAAAAQSTADAAETRANGAKTDAANALTVANSKLGATAKAADSDKLDGYDWGQSGKNVRATEFYADNWFRNYNSGEGLYNQATTQHWYSDGDDYWNIAGGGSFNAIRFRDEHAGTQRGLVGADNSNRIGFLDAGGSWAVRHDNDSGTLFYTDNETLEFRVGRDKVTGNYGTVQTDSTRSGWSGYSIQGNFVFMSSGTGGCGIFNDVDNEWMAYFNRNAGTELHHNGSSKLTTTSTGVSVTGTVTATAFSGNLDWGNVTNKPTIPNPIAFTDQTTGQNSTLASMTFDGRAMIFTMANGSSFSIEGVRPN
jgi:hypothetical protein